MLGRAVVGGVLLGETAAAVGGLTGKRKINFKTTSVKALHTELTAELSFNDGTSLYVLLKSIKSFHWLLSYVSKNALTDVELRVEKQKAVTEKEVYEKKKIEISKAIRRGNTLYLFVVWGGYCIVYYGSS